MKQIILQRYILDERTANDNYSHLRTRGCCHALFQKTARHITRTVHKDGLREHLKGVLFKFGIQACFSSGFCVLIELSVLYQTNVDTVLCFSYVFIRI